MMSKMDKAQQLIYYNSVLSAIRDINQLFIKEKNQDAFIQKSCEILVKTNCYHNAWIVLLDEQGNYLNCGKAGMGKDFQALIELLQKKERTKCISKVLEDSTLIIIEENDIRCGNCPLNKLCEQSRTYYMQLGFNNKIFGILSVTILKSFAKDAKEQTLFQNIAESISFILQSIEREKEIKKSKSRYKALFEAINDAIFVHPLKHENFNNFIDVNDVACKRLGYSREELLKMTPKDISAPDDTALRGNKDQRGKLLRDNWMIFQAVHITKSRKKIPVELSSRIFDYEGKPVIMTMARDITERKKNELELENYRINLENLVKDRTEDLESSNEELFEKNNTINKQNSELKATLFQLKETQSQLFQSEKMASLGVLTAGVAHEINNPLNYIMGSFVGLSNYFKENKNNNKEVNILLKALKTGVNKAASIVNGLNQFSRSKEDYNEKCDIHSIIDNCMLMLHNKYKNRIEINKKYTNKTLLIKGNVGKLHQVFINVLTNSIQAIKNKGKILINTQIVDNIAVIKIIDTGSGISKKNILKITDPFFTTKDPGKGTGLGLSITYSIIQDHKGDIEFISEPDKGTTIILKLPIKI